MSRFASGISLAGILVACLISSACSTPSVTTVVQNIVPAEVDLCVSPSSVCSGGLNLSVEVGQVQALLATAKNHLGVAVTETFSYQSSNPAVLTIAADGSACAGTWDSLTSPAVCTPGPTGVSQVTATTQGVSSPPVAIYVHQHITGVSISKVPNQPPTLSSLCLSEGAPSGPESVLYQAFAFNGTADITSSVGPFSWQSVLSTGQTTSAVTLTSPPTGAPLNQEIATANAPGITPFFATVSNFHSQPVQFETCPVQTISLAAAVNPGTTTSFVVNTGTTTTLDATVTDILGMNLVGVPLTWQSTNPVSVTALGATSTVYGSVGTISASSLGGAAVTASCTPPTCNGGISPSLPIYPPTAMSFTVRGTSIPTAPTVYVSSTGCSTTAVTCNTTVAPVTKSPGGFTVGDPVLIPFTPNSIEFDNRGLAAYLGVDSSSFGTKGLITFTGTAASSVTNAAGKVLAVSPTVTLANSQPVTLVILSDTVDTPNQVFVYNTTSQTAVSFLMDNAVAAAFSPDGLKAYIVSGNSCPGTTSAGCLLISSTVEAAQTVPLPAPATDVAFIGEGSFGYFAGGDPAGAAVLPTCSDPNPLLSLSSLNLVSQLLRPLPDGQSALALAPPNVQRVTTTITGIPTQGTDGCPAPRGFLTISNAVGSAFNLGVGTFTPTQFIISPDGSAAYILGKIPQTAPNPPLRFPFIIVFNLATQIPSNISLAGNASPLTASLTPAGDLLFVGADDGAVHVIDTATLADTQQITFPFPTNSLCFGPGRPPTQAPVNCLPDLVAVKP